MKDIEEKIYKILSLELHPLNRDLTVELSYYLFLILNREKRTIKHIDSDFTEFVNYMRDKFGDDISHLQDFVPELDGGKIKYFYKGQNHKIFYGVNASNIYDWFQQFEIIYSELEKPFVQSLNISPMKFFLLALSLQNRVLDFLLQNDEYLESLSKEVELGQLYFPSDESWFEPLRNTITFKEHDMKLILEGLKFSKEEQNLFFNSFVVSVNNKENFNIDSNIFVEKFNSNEVDTYWFIKLGDSYYLRPKNISMVLINNFAKIFVQNFYTKDVLDMIKNRLVFELANRIYNNVDYVKVMIGSEIKDKNGIDYKSDLLLVVDGLYFLPIDIVYPPKEKEVDLTEEAKKLKINSDLVRPTVTGFDLETVKSAVGEYYVTISKDKFFPFVITPAMDFGRYQISSDELDTSINFVSLDEFLGFIEEIDNGISLVKFLKQFRNLRENTEISQWSSFGEIFSAFKLRKCLSFGGIPYQMISLLNIWGSYRQDSLSKKWTNIIKFISNEKPFIRKVVPLGNDLFFAFIPNRNLQAKVLVIRNKFYLWFMKNAKYLSGRDLLINTFLIDMLSYYFSKTEDFLYENLKQHRYIHFYFYSVEALNEHKKDLKGLLAGIQTEDLENPYTFVVNKVYNSIDVTVIFNEKKIAQLFDRSKDDNDNELEFVKKLLYSIGLTPSEELFLQFSGKPRNVFKHMDFPVPLKEHLPEPMLPTKEDECFAEGLTFKACYKYGFKPGKYYGEEAKTIINKIVSYLESILYKEINKYNKEDLLNKFLLEIECFEFKLLYTEEQNRTGVETYIEYDPINSLSEVMNEEQRFTKAVTYLIEFLLKNSNNKLQTYITNVELSELLALGDELFTLYSISDNIYYGIWSNYGFEITEQYEIRQLEEEPQGYQKLIIKASSQKLFGKVESLDSQEENSIYFEKLDTTFKKDLDFTFMDLMSVLAVLRDGSYDEEKLNVVQIFNSKEELAKTIKERANLYPKLDINSIDNVLDYLILRKENINEYKPTKISNDEHRFRIKPLIETDDKKIIFGRFSIYRTFIIWLYRILEGLFPYSIRENANYSTINSALNDRKTFLDKKLEDFVFKLVDKVKQWDICEKDLDLHRSFGENFPQDLGDFDVFGLSIENKEILLIEAKDLRSSFVPSEIKREYKSLFHKERNDRRVDYATKFAERIRFVKDNLEQILKSLGIKATDKKWKVKNYFVMRNLSYNLFNIPNEFKSIEFINLQDLLKRLT